ncbi:MAG: biotin--[acetyl-CoA-carboxylase] ligase [Lachnospiraceae bacterium]|nr:biotin--[acetyl-CoA-carboxylase] ligase [Lachnospiraceae bacterium]
MKTDKSDILALLRNSEDYVSGQQLCDKFDVTRTAVWKVINQLKEEGYLIESVPRKGYRLVESPTDILSESEIASRLTTKWAGRKVYYYDVTGSTNNDAKRLAEEGDPHGTVVVADIQNAGKGRRGRQWQTLPGTALSFTLLLRPEFAADKASMITLVMALSVAEAVEEAADIAATIKWPNDIVVNKKKICGMLTEMTMTPEMDEIQYIVVGAGINVNNGSSDEFQEEIRRTATSLKIETGRHFSRAKLLERVLVRFEANYAVFLETLDLSRLRDAYQRHLQGVGAEVRVLDPAGEYTGVSQGIDDRGELIVIKDNGEKVQVYAGEVSVRGLYGYV